MAEDSLLKATREIEKAVGVKPGFFIALLKEEGDWSFVIKLHALIEAAVTHLLVVKSGAEKLETVYAQLELSDNRKGKLAFVRELGLLDSMYRRLIVTLSEIRNRFVHDIKNVNITLEEYVRQLDTQQRQNFIEAVSLDFDVPIEINGKNIPIGDFISENPKTGIWMAAMRLLGIIYFKKKDLKKRQIFLKKAEGLANALAAYKVERRPLSK